MTAMQLKSIELSTGVRLEYVENGSPEAPVVLFIHGWLDTWFSFSPVMDALSEQYHSYAPTLRGHGLSDKPAEGYAMTDFTADLIAFMDQLDIAKAHLVGHSMGAIISLRIAIDHPDRVDRVALFGGCAKSTENQPLLDMVEPVKTMTDPVPVADVREFVESLFVSKADPMFVDRLIREELLAPVNTWRAVLDGLLAVDYLAELGNVASPTLLFWGTRDELFGRADQDAITERVPRSRLQVWNEVGHAMQWEDAQRAADALRAYFGPAEITWPVVLR